MGQVVMGALKGIFTRILTAVFRTPLASAAFLYSIAGGLAMTTTFLGDWISSFVGLFWSWTPYVLFFTGAALVIGDVCREGIAERMAIYIPLPLFSVALAIPKDAPMRKDIIGWVDTLADWLDKHIGTYIGATGQAFILTLVALTSIVFAVLVCERWGKKSTVSGRPTAATTTAPSVTPRRRTAA